jgi:hypothetical protein
MIDERPRTQPGVLAVLSAELRCALSTLILLIRGQIRMPRAMVGREIVFADGSTSRVYRETVLRARGESPQVVLAVRFRLRLIGSNAAGHALFRWESLLNTLLFAAHQGFRTKLWLTDRDTGYYRGVYEWQDAESATAYAEVLWVVLEPWVETGSFGYRVIDGIRRRAFLAGRVSADSHSVPDDLWWRPVSPVPANERTDGT